MTADGPAPAVQHFVDYFGELGPRWGLPADACRVHAYLYVVAAPVTEARVRTALSLDAEQLTAALAFLIDYRMAEQLGAARWRTSITANSTMSATFRRSSQSSSDPASTLERFRMPLMSPRRCTPASLISMM